MIDLFAGAGLFSSAFLAEGFKPIYAVEQDRFAAQTYASQIGEHIETADIRQCIPAQAADVLVAGPPCQGFSTLGKRDPNDPRNGLSLEVVRWAAACNPSIVVIENVAAFLDAPVWTHLARELQLLGFTVEAMVLDAQFFGVPQKRLRSFTIASKVGPIGVEAPHVPQRATVRSAWIGLAAVPDGNNLHYSPTPSTLALGRMQAVPPGGNKRDIMERAPHLAAPSWWKLGHQVGDIWGRMLWDEPANTLRTCLQDPTKGRYLHPEQHRVISLREAARLHSIPDTWTFHGPPLRVSRQIGNSVPPLLGRAVARGVAKALGF